MICQKCGAVLMDQAAFCSVCGTKLTPVQPTAPQPQPTPDTTWNQPPYVENDTSYHPPRTAGNGKATASVVLGVIGLIFGGILWGILALFMSKKALELGTTKESAAKAGRILGIIDIIWFFLLLIIRFAAV